MTAPLYVDGLVTVVLPAFNVAPYVGAAVESVLGQTYSTLELIAVDDGSTDATLEELARRGGDARLRVMRQPNAGASAARNTGIVAGRGEYIAFIDGDDVWLPDKLRTHIEYLEQTPGADLSFALSRVIDEHGRETGRVNRQTGGPVAFRHLFTRNVIGNGSAVVMRRSALDAAGYFDEQLYVSEEHDVWLRVALLRPRNVHCIPCALSLYRMRPNQITKDWRRTQRAWVRFDEKIQLAAPDETAGARTEAHARMLRYLAYIAYESGETEWAAAHLRAAIALCPISILSDRGTWLLMGGLTAARLFPARVQRRIDSAARAAIHGSYRLRRFLSRGPSASHG